MSYEEHSQNNQNELCKNELNNKFCNSKFWRTYVNAPVNLSFLTGWRYPGIPRLKGNPLAGRLFSFLQADGPLNNFLAAGEIAKNHSLGMCYFWLGPQAVLFITKPEHIKQILMEDKDKISSQQPLKLFKAFFGSNIFVDPDDLWEQKKTIYAKWLNKKKIFADYENSLKTAVDHCISYLRTSSNAISLQELASKFTLHVVLKQTMPYLTIDNGLLDPVGKHLAKIDENLFSAKNLFKWNLPALILKLFFKDANPSIIKQQMQTTFNELLFSNQEDSIKTTDNFIKDIWQLNNKQLTSLQENLSAIYGDANIVLLAGVETTASTLQFLLKLLCAYPEVESRLRAELSAHFSAGNGSISIMDINHLPYLDSVVKETLRVYPPAPAVLRTVKEPFKIDNVPVYKGDMIIFSPFVTHRLQAVWGEDSELFKPERFLTTDTHEINAAYLPFSKGPRACIGRDLALIEIKALVAAMLMNFEITIDHNDFQISLARGALKPKIITKACFKPIRD